MKDKDKINLEEFTQITDKLSPEMFLCVYIHFILDLYVDKK